MNNVRVLCHMIPVCLVTSPSKSECVVEVHEHIMWYGASMIINMYSKHCGLVTPYGGRDLGQHWLR